MAVDNAIRGPAHFHGSRADKQSRFILGGLSSTASDFTLHNDVQTATLGNDGAITSTGWRATTALPNGRSGLGAVFFADHIYVVGGYAKSGTLADTLSAPILPDSGIGAWKVSSSTLNIPRSNFRLEIFKDAGWSFLLGAIAGVGEIGADTVHFDSIEVAPLRPDGSVGDWHLCPFHLKGGRSAPATIVEAGFLYVLGGWGDRLDEVFRDVQYAKARNDGCLEPWQTSPNPLNMPLYGHVATIVKSGSAAFLIAVGGNGGEGNYFNNVQSSRLVAGGGVGPWAFERHTLAIARWGQAIIRYSDFI